MPKAGEPKHKIRVDRESGRAFLGSRVLRLGRRVPRVPDDRDAQHPYKVPRGGKKMLSTATYKTWYDLTWRGDQGNTPQCVAYSALHRLENAPLTRPSAGPVLDPATYYKRAQQLDEWPGEDYDGSSVRAGAKVALEGQWISEYTWISPSFLTNTLDAAIVQTLTDGGPVIGVNWYYSMFTPVWVKDAAGTYRWTIKVDDSMGIAGGHAIWVSGVNIPGRVFRLTNSWGQGWGSNGRAWISFTDFTRLVFDEDGDCCVYREIVA